MVIFHSYVELPEGNMERNLEIPSGHQSHGCRISELNGGLMKGTSLIKKSGWWCSYPSEKYESIGLMIFPTEWKNKSHVPNHQPAAPQFLSWFMDVESAKHMVISQVLTHPHTIFHSNYSITLGLLNDYLKCTTAIAIFTEILGPYGTNFRHAALRFSVKQLDD